MIGVETKEPVSSNWSKEGNDGEGLGPWALKGLFRFISPAHSLPKPRPPHTIHSFCTHAKCLSSQKKAESSMPLTLSVRQEKWAPPKRCEDGRRPRELDP